MGTQMSKRSRSTELIDGESNKEAQALTLVNSLKFSMQSLVEKNLYSDLIVICGNDRYPLHKAIVCPRSQWFEQKCAEALTNEDYPQNPHMTVLHLSDNPIIVAMMISYLYLLDYSESEPPLLFSSPNAIYDYDPWEDEEAQMNDKPINSHLVEAVSKKYIYDGEHSDVCSSEFAMIADEGNMKPDSIHSRLTQDFCSTVLDEEDEGLGSKARRRDDCDPGKRPHPLTLHIQMYKAGVEYSIPCLAGLAFHRFDSRVQSDMVGIEELIEAMNEAYPERRREDGFQKNFSRSRRIQEALAQVMRKKWSLIKERSDFEDLILRKPEVGRDMLKFL